MYDITTGNLVKPFLNNDEYYVSLNGNNYTIAKLVLNTFVGNLDSDIEYNKSFDFYDTQSIRYKISSILKDNENLIINGIRFVKLKKYKYYYISNDGIIYSVFYNKFVIKSFNHLGYPTVSLVDNNGKRTPRKVHRLVYETFIGELKPDMIIDHLNGKKWCSSWWNLEQVSYRTNVKRAYDLGLNPTGKWNDLQIHQICRMLQENYTSRDILANLGLDESEFRNLTLLIHNIIHGKYYVEISKAYDIREYNNALNKKDRKLSIDDVKWIKRELVNGNRTVKSIAARFNCSSSTIRKIRDNKTWKNIRYVFND